MRVGECRLRPGRAARFSAAGSSGVRVRDAPRPDSDNYKVYVAKYQADLEREHMGKVALMPDGELIEVHDNYDNA